MNRGDEAQAFLRALWSEDPLSGLLAISWTGEGGFKMRAFNTIEAAAEFGVQAPGDVYLRVCSLRPDFRGSGRGKAADSWALPALVADLDVKRGAFVDIAAAWAYLDALPLTPSIVVSSGAGLHVWWVLEELLPLDTPERRDEGGALTERWRGFCRYKAVEAGADLDTASDLARVLRLPGTENHKYTPPRKVTLARISGERHSLSTFTGLFRSATEAANRTRPLTTDPAPVEIDRGELTEEDKRWFRQVLTRDPRLWRYYSGSWRDLVTVGTDGGIRQQYQSASEADYAFLGFLIRYGADDGRAQRIFRSSALMRSKADERRGEGTYLTHTIGRLRARQVEVDGDG